MVIFKCLGVLVVKILIGLFMEVLGKSLFFNFLVIGFFSLGILSLFFERVLVSIIFGLLVWVIIVKFFFFNLGKVKI